jgi:hypothetical protein
MALAALLSLGAAAAIGAAAWDWGLALGGAGLAVTDGDRAGFWLETGAAAVGATWLLCRLGKKPWEP